MVLLINGIVVIVCTAVISGVGQGGGGAPLFGQVCTLNERKGFLLQYVSHKC